MIKEKYALNESKAKELKEGIEKTINNYKTNINILELLKEHIKTKKNGEDFQNFNTMAIDLNGLNEKLKAMNIKLYYYTCDYYFNFYYYNSNYKKIEFCINRRIYLDSLKQEEQEQARQTHMIHEAQYIRPHYFVNTKKELLQQITKTQKSMIKWLNDNNSKLNCFDKLYQAAQNFINELNNNCIFENEEGDQLAAFYRSEIASLFNY